MDHKMHEVAKIVPHKVQIRETDQGLFVMETWELNHSPNTTNRRIYQFKIQIIEMKTNEP